MNAERSAERERKKYEREMLRGRAIGEATDRVVAIAEKCADYLAQGHYLESPLRRVLLREVAKLRRVRDR
jgi:hypothetical protein